MSPGSRSRTTPARRVTVGDILAVDLDRSTRSVGDAWFLVTAPDPAVLVDRGDDVESDCDSRAAASSSGGRSAVAAGTATVTFRYCYRTPLARCGPRPGEPGTLPIPLEITVTP